jgi:hypothetical protein
MSLGRTNSRVGFPCPRGTFTGRTAALVATVRVVFAALLFQGRHHHVPRFSALEFLDQLVERRA